MIILPAIDLYNGNCVRLYKGDFETAHNVSGSALNTAAQFEADGAKWLHIVDLNGAKTGEKVNRNLIIDLIKQTTLKTELGGGIRDIETVRDYLENGACRVILGSAALRQPDFVKQAVSEFGGKIAVGIDAKDGFVSTEGWLNKSKVNYLDFAKQMESIGVKYIIFTDIDTDGTLTQPNFEQLQALCGAVSCNIIASGGIRDAAHIEKLTAMNLYGAICGKSIYSGTLDLKEAVKLGGVQ